MTRLASRRKCGGLRGQRVGQPARAASSASTAGEAERARARCPMRGQQFAAGQIGSMVIAELLASGAA